MINKPALNKRLASDFYPRNPCIDHSEVYNALYSGKVTEDFADNLISKLNRIYAYYCF